MSCVIKITDISLIFSGGEPKRRRLWVLRGLVKMFRRRVKRRGGTDSSTSPQPPAPTLRARSASELAVDQGLRWDFRHIFFNVKIIYDSY